MIVSAISLWKKFNLETPLNSKEWGEEIKDGVRFSHVTYSGHTVEDGSSVRIYARFSYPMGKIGAGVPVLLLLSDAGKKANDELLAYFSKKGYAVLAPDYSGEIVGELHTEYPALLYYGNYDSARGLYDMENLPADKTTWFEWTYIALTSIKYLKSRADVNNIGVIGFNKGGEIAWQTMLSPDVKCGIPVNAAGWLSFRDTPKFATAAVRYLSDDMHRYIAAVEAQQYAPNVKCPVLMLCTLRDRTFDCDRAYDTYTRIGNRDGNALAYCVESGACVDENGLLNIDLFLERNLKGRAIYIPDTLNISMEECADGVEIKVHCDEEGLLAETGIYYAEAPAESKPSFRDWRCVFEAQGDMTENNKVSCVVKRFSGATSVFAFAYARYINGFQVTSRIICKNLSNVNEEAIRNRKLYSGTEENVFSVADYSQSAINGVLLEASQKPKKSVGYANITGIYAVGGVRTYRIGSPEFTPNEDAILQFEAYAKEWREMKVSVEIAGNQQECYSAVVSVRGRGKWKRILLRSEDLKGEKSGTPLASFRQGGALVFSCAGEEGEFAITNVLWL